LQHEYGIAPQDIHWFRRRSEHVPIEIPAGIRIDSIGKDQTLDGLIEEGGLDALAVTQPPQPFLKGSPRVQRLFADSRGVEADYYRRTKIFPIMHMVVIRRAIYESDGKALGLRSLRRRSLSHAMVELGFGICPSTVRERYLALWPQEKSADVGSGDAVFE
jgi:hypothetical protein